MQPESFSSCSFFPTVQRGAFLNLQNASSSVRLWKIKISALKSFFKDSLVIIVMPDSMWPKHKWKKIFLHKFPHEFLNVRFKSNILEEEIYKKLDRKWTTWKHQWALIFNPSWLSRNSWDSSKVFNKEALTTCPRIPRSYRVITKVWRRHV